jgi:hypothetical protein
MSCLGLAGDGEGVMKAFTMSVRSASDGVLLCARIRLARVEGVSLVGVVSLVSYITTSINAIFPFAE